MKALGVAQALDVSGYGLAQHAEHLSDGEGDTHAPAAI
jgi:hypothetical protein